MTNASGEVFIDTSLFKALVDPSDEFHKQAISLWDKLEVEGATLTTSNYVLDESFTLIRARCGVETVEKFRQSLLTSTFVLKIVRVTVSDEANAWKWFLKDWSKLSFTDCVSFVIMRRLHVVRAGTFDKHFVRAGFRQEEGKDSLAA